MKNLSLFLILVISLSLGCKKAFIYQSINQGLDKEEIYELHRPASKPEAKHIHQYKLIDSDKSLSHSIPAKVTETASPAAVHIKVHPDVSSRSQIGKMELRKIKQDLKKKDSDFWVWFIFVILLTLVFAGLFWLLSVLFPTLGLTFVRVATYILIFYAAVFLLIWWGNAPRKGDAKVAEPKPCQEVECPSYGCDEGKINIADGKIDCVRCKGTGTICK
jgi:hypothetical protein